MKNKSAYISDSSIYEFTQNVRQNASMLEVSYFWVSVQSHFAHKFNTSAGSNFNFLANL